jgi:hypothetical protein
MNANIQPDEEPEEPRAAPPDDNDDSKSKGKRHSYRGVRRELSDEELKSPVVQKTLLDEIDRLDAEVEEAKSYRNRFHEVDKREAILREKFTVHTGYEIASTTLVTGGGILLGFVSSIWDNQPTAGVLLVVGSLAVIAGAFMTKIRIKQ